MDRERVDEREGEIETEQERDSISHKIESMCK